MDVGAAGAGDKPAARRLAVDTSAAAAGRTGVGSGGQGAGAPARARFAATSGDVGDSDSSGEDTANVKVRKLFIPSPTEGVAVLAGIVRPPRVCTVPCHRARTASHRGRALRSRGDKYVRQAWPGLGSHGVMCVGSQIKGDKPYLDKLIAIQKLNGMFLRLKSFT